jgi:hypothetical protein
VVETVSGGRREITKQKAVVTELDGEPHYKTVAILGGGTSRQRPGVMLPHIPPGPASGEADGSAPRSGELTDATPAWPAIGGTGGLSRTSREGGPIRPSSPLSVVGYGTGTGAVCSTSSAVFSRTEHRDGPQHRDVGTSVRGPGMTLSGLRCALPRRRRSVQHPLRRRFVGDPAVGSAAASRRNRRAIPFFPPALRVAWRFPKKISRQMRQNEMCPIAVRDQRFVCRHRPGNAESGVAPEEDPIVLGRVIGTYFILCRRLRYRAPACNSRGRTLPV